MAQRTWTPRDMQFYLMLSQTGFEMVGPIIIGVVADHYLATTPWLTVAGAVLGPIAAVTHMVLLIQRHEARAKAERENPAE